VSLWLVRGLRFTDERCDINLDDRLDRLARHSASRQLGSDADRRTWCRESIQTSAPFH